MKDWAAVTVLTCLTLLPIATARSGEQPDANGLTPPVKVAVLVEQGMPQYGGFGGIAPPQVARLLRQYGIENVQDVTVHDITDGRLAPQTCPVLVMLTGNAFPKPAFEMLRTYHRQGGCLVMTGVPFCHPCEKTGDEWKSTGHANHFQHDATGMGTGGFTGAAEGRLRVEHYGFGANLLGLANDVPLSGKGRRQCLDAKSLDPADEVIPIVGFFPKGKEKPLPAAAIVRHKCALFKGAVDAWLGQIAPKAEADEHYLARQVLVRSVAFCLHEKGAISMEEMKAVFARMDAAARPTPLPSGLAFKPEPRPWGDTYLPKSPPPARRLLVVNAAKCSPAQKIALWCLQGLVSRTQPRFWIDFGSEDTFWLDWHVEKKHIDGHEAVNEWRALFDTFRAEFKGAVVPDPKLYRSDLLAANIAACEDLIVATPELAEELKIPVKIDLRGRFASYAEGMEWVWRSYKGKFNRHLCGYHCPQRMSVGAFAYLLQWRGVIFWLAGSVDGAEPGADTMAEKQVLAAILAEMAPNTAVLGFPYGGEGIGPGEPAGVEFASTYAKALVCNDFLRNTCVTSGVRVEAWTQPRQSPTPELDRRKIYIALALSDGDNQNVWRGFHRRYFEHKDHGKVPVAYGMGPAIADIQPAVAQWYYEHAAPDTEFFADVSGIGYTKPDAYGAAYTDRNAVLDGFLDWTRIYLDRMDMQTLRTVRGDDPFLSRYVERIPKMHSILADMGCYSGYKGIAKLTYTLNDMPVFRAATTWRDGVDGFLPEVRQHVGTGRPAFVNGFLHCWTFNDLDKIHSVHAKRDADMVFVTPSQLAELYRRARKQGWVK